MSQHEHSFPLGMDVCACGAIRPDVWAPWYDVHTPPEGFAADSNPPYGHDCGPECTCFSGLSERDEYERTVLGMIVAMPGETFSAWLCRSTVYLTAMWNYDHPVYGPPLQKRAYPLVDAEEVKDVIQHSTESEESE